MISFRIFVQNIGGVSNEYPQSVLGQNKKKMVYPCKPQFCYITMGFKGVYISRTCFPDAFQGGDPGKSLCDKLVVAAIDFGTTYSGYAFSFKHEYEKEPTKVSSNNWTAGTRGLVSLKTPTTLLLRPDKTFEAFGYEAEDRYADLALDEEHGDWYYFRRFKMMLFEKIVSAISAPLNMFLTYRSTRTFTMTICLVF